MSFDTRRRLLATVCGLLTLSGCSTERRSTTTGATQTSGRSRTDERGWVGLEVENNDDVVRTVTVVVELDGEQEFARTLSLRPQAEPEFEAIFPIPDSERQVTVEADLEDGGSTSYSSTLGPGDDRRLYVTVGRNGALVVGRHEPPEPNSTTESA